MTSSFTSAQSEQDALDRGIDTIVIGSAADLQTQYLDQSADTVVLSAVESPWGEGDGLNGDIHRPKDLESLVEIFDQIQFDSWPLRLITLNYVKKLHFFVRPPPTPIFIIFTYGKQF